MSVSNLKILRTEKGLSQKDLAVLIHVHQTAISAWEKGRSTPDAQSALKLADALNVSVEYLLGRTEEKITFNATHNKAPVNQGSGSQIIGETPFLNLAQEELEIITILRNADMQTRVDILNFFLALKKKQTTETGTQ